MNTIRYGQHTLMGPSLVEYDIRGVDGSRQTWFWFDGSRKHARETAKEALESLADRLNHGKHEVNRITEKDIRVYVDEVQVQMETVAVRPKRKKKGDQQ